MKKKLTREQMKENARKITPPMYTPPGELRPSAEIMEFCRSILGGREFQAAQDRLKMNEVEFAKKYPEFVAQV